MSDGEAEKPAPTDPPQPPVPPAPEHRRVPGDANLVEYLARRVETLQREMEAAQRRAQEAHTLLRQQESLRGDVEDQLKSLSDQMRREKSQQELDDERSRARGRVDALEKRLDDMHQSWASLLKDAISARDAGVEAVRGEISSLKENLGILPKLLPDLQALHSRLPMEQDAREEQARRLESLIQSRLDELDRRLALEMEKQRDRASALSRERSAVEEALQEQKAQVQTEYLKERVALQAQFNDQAEQLRKMAGGLLADREGESEHARALKELVDRFHQMVHQPAHAKDEILRELEQEKRDLMTALKERNHQLQQNTSERREIERSLGETLLQLNRQLEEERARYQTLECSVGKLQQDIRALESKLELALREGENKDSRFATLAAERDELMKALLAEAEKARGHIAARVEGDAAWEARLQQAAQQLSEERTQRIVTDGTVAELRAQLQTLSEHLSRALQEKDSAGSQTLAWRQEKEQLAAALRKKDEMIAMLSSTFQGLIRPKNS